MSPMPVTQTNRTLNTLRALREIPPGTDERLDIARRHRRNVWPQCMSWTPTEDVRRKDRSMNTATAITTITTVTISDTTIEGFDVCAACPRSLIVDFALTMLEPIEGGHTMVTFPKSEIAERLNAIPRGTMLRVASLWSTSRYAVEAFLPACPPLAAHDAARGILLRHMMEFAT